MTQLGTGCDEQGGRGRGVEGGRRGMLSSAQQPSCPRPARDSPREEGGDAAPPGAPLPSPPGHLRLRARVRGSDRPSLALVSPPSQRSLPAPTASYACPPARLPARGCGSRPVLARGRRESHTSTSTSSSFSPGRGVQCSVGAQATANLEQASED
ncbi:uncharacterized protein LOC144457091 isoform X2 [Phascolarctos cinereus]